MVQKVSFVSIFILLNPVEASRFSSIAHWGIRPIVPPPQRAKIGAKRKYVS